MHVSHLAQWWHTFWLKNGAYYHYQYKKQSEISSALSCFWMGIYGGKVMK